MERGGTTKFGCHPPPGAAGDASPGPRWADFSVMVDPPPALLVSSCLLGTPCNHQAGHSRRETVAALGATYRLVPVCPEVCGGLSTPRPAAERVGERVVKKQENEKRRK